MTSILQGISACLYLARTDGQPSCAISGTTITARYAGEQSSRCDRHYHLGATYTGADIATSNFSGGQHHRHGERRLLTSPGRQRRGSQQRHRGHGNNGQSMTI
jgi:hypothetical protein